MVKLLTTVLASMLINNWLHLQPNERLYLINMNIPIYEKFQTLCKDSWKIDEQNC